MWLTDPEHKKVEHKTRTVSPDGLRYEFTVDREATVRGFAFMQGNHQVNVDYPMKVVTPKDVVTVQLSETFAATLRIKNESDQ